MAKTATVTKSKAATKTANDKTRAPKTAKEDKPKREPTAYQSFCKAHMKAWNEANPGRSKEAMTQMGLLWKDAPENPNRGKEPKARKSKDPKDLKASSKPVIKARAMMKSTSKPVEEEEDGLDDEKEKARTGSSDDVGISDGTEGSDD